MAIDDKYCSGCRSINAGSAAFCNVCGMRFSTNPTHDSSQPSTANTSWVLLLAAASSALVMLAGGGYLAYTSRAQRVEQINADLAAQEQAAAQARAQAEEQAQEALARVGHARDAVDQERAHMLSQFYTLQAAGRAREVGDHCQAQARGVNGRGVNGRVVIGFFIASDGQVTDAGIQSNDTGDDALATCLQDRVSGWHFAPTGGDAVQVGVPFVFNDGVRAAPTRPSSSARQRQSRRTGAPMWE